MKDFFSPLICGDARIHKNEGNVIKNNPFLLITLREAAGFFEK